MASSFSGFASSTRRWGRNVLRNADQLVRRCAIATDGAVVLATPVDTGRARANWQVECNSPIETTTSAVSPSGQESITAARAAIERYTGGSPQAAIYITNNLPYIGRLNDGWSAQQPAGFVERSVMVGVNAVHSAGGIVSRQVSGTVIL